MKRIWFDFGGTGLIVSLSPFTPCLVWTLRSFVAETEGVRLKKCNVINYWMQFCSLLVGDVVFLNVGGAEGHG